MAKSPGRTSQYKPAEQRATKIYKNESKIFELARAYRMDTFHKPQSWEAVIERIYEDTQKSLDLFRDTRLFSYASIHIPYTGYIIKILKRSAIEYCGVLPIEEELTTHALPEIRSYNKGGETHNLISNITLNIFRSSPGSAIETKLTLRVKHMLSWNELNIPEELFKIRIRQVSPDILLFERYLQVGSPSKISKELESFCKEMTKFFSVNPLDTDRLETKQYLYI